MDIEPEANKVDAIFELRDAVETKVHAEFDYEAQGTEAARVALAAAEDDVEIRTQVALQTCHECGHEYEDDGDGHSACERISDRRGNVIAVDFRQQAERA